MQALYQNKDRWLEFYSEFSQLLADLNWNNAAKTAQLLGKINNELSNALVPIRPKPKQDEFDEWVALLTDISENIEANHARRQQQNQAKQLHNTPRYPYAGPPAPQNTPAQNTPVPPAQTHGEPMELDAMKLSNTERMRRLQNNLCLYCGESSHFKSSCQAKARADQTRGQRYPQRPRQTQTQSPHQPQQTYQNHKLRVIEYTDDDSSTASNFIPTPALSVSPTPTPRSVSPSTNVTASQQLKEQPSA